MHVKHALLALAIGQCIVMAAADATTLNAGIIIDFTSFSLASDHNGHRLGNHNDSNTAANDDAVVINRPSWWRALLDKPFILNRRPKRRLNKGRQVESDSSTILIEQHHNDQEDHTHRFLAFGDYTDPTFSCPATITCPLVCVATIEDCPQDSLCPGTHPDREYDENHEYELCADGTCADTTAGEACNADLESPCECENLPFLCAKQVDLKDDCHARFQEYYDANALCIEEQTESIPQVDFGGPWFVGLSVGLAGVTFLMLVWCAYNQRWASVVGSTVPLEIVTMNNNADESASAFNTTQTGYKATPVGMVLYSLVILVHLVIQYLLLALTVEYYVQQEAATVYFFGQQVFYDEIQVLMAFEIVWMVGFVWCFFLKYPISIHSIFLRRCLHSEASYVAVSAPVQVVDTHYKIKWIVQMLSRMGTAFGAALSFLYSDKSQHSALGTKNKVTFCKVRTDKRTGSRYFYFRMRRYVFDVDTSKFIPGRWHMDATIGQWLDKSYLYQGITSDDAIYRLGTVGPNVLDLKRPTVLGAIRHEFSKPFYLYQNFMVWTWAPFWYYYMAIVQTVVRVTGGLVVAIFQCFSDKNLYQLMVMEGSAEVIRNGNIIEVNQTEVVPGDIVRLKPGLAYFDMAILQSPNLIVNESALTGEVHPIAKVALDPANSDAVYDPKANKTSTISAGTTIIECGEGEGKSGDLAVVTQTGSFTAKGELLCDVLAYERHKFKFDTEVKLVLAILCVEAAIFMTIVLLVLEDHWVYGWFYAMFVVGTVLPPLLPTVFVVSVGISCKRLNNIGISCTDSRGILVAGKVKKAFFDKTGTLTQQGLDFISALRADELEDKNIMNGNVTDPVLRRGLAVCHMLNPSKNGGLIGAAVDQMGFSATSAQMLSESTVKLVEGETIKYIKRFEFNHHSMTQSVIIQHGEESIVYVKGSPEAIAKICDAASIPADFEEKARHFARNGIYQLAIATAPFSSTKAANDVKREDIERNLTFAGVINFENRMKEDTPLVIQELTEGNIDSAMITGDNVLTGIFIAKKAGLIEPDKPVVVGNNVCDDQVIWLSQDGSTVPAPPIDSLEAFTQTTSLALTGEVWNYLLTLDPEAAIAYAKHTHVFGRCTPNDKVSIVSTFVEMGKITLMCGDGGNDCGALKAAHVGIALSDAEASVVAPFTSLDKTITSVTEVLKEGRCALASALAVYKYMIMYGQVESINQVANAYLSITFTEWCWVFMDGIWTLTMAFSLPLANAAKKLSHKLPTASILGAHTMTSACGILAINVLFLVYGLLALWSQDWFQCRKWDSKDVSNILAIGDNYETSVIFIITGYQYISSAAAFNFGYTYRASWFRNYIFVFFFLLWTAMHFASTLSATKFSCIWRLNCDNDHAVRWVTSTEPEPINNIYNTTVMPVGFRWLLVVMMVVNLILICAWDYYVVNKFLPKLAVKLGLKDDSQHANVKNCYVPPQTDLA